jgi:hypothetical protein
MNDILANMNKDERFLIDNIIANNYIIDYGFIKSISADKTHVDVEHAIIPVDDKGKDNGKTVTTNVEVMFTGSSYFTMTFDLKIGDSVLLLGSKDFIDDLKNKNTPVTADYFLHYKQENLKAFPFGFPNNPSNKINITQTVIEILQGSNNRIAIDNGLLDLKNSVSNMKTQLQDLWAAIISINTNLQSWTSINCVVGSPVTPNPATIALFVADNISDNIKKNNVASFLK